MRKKPYFYKQYDTKYAKIGNGKGQTIGNNGCGPCACANVIRGLGVKNVTPETIWKYFCKNGYMTAMGSVHAGIPNTLKHYGIETTKIETGQIKKVKSALKAGDWVLALMSPGKWAINGHFIVVYGIHDGNKLYISDSGSNADSRQKNGTIQEFSGTFVRGWRINDVKTKYKGGTNTDDGSDGGDDPEDWDSESDGGGGGLQVNWEAINPYILTIGREDNPKKFKCEEWKENKVIGVMLEAGYYFNKNHTVAKLFRNQNLYDQCLKVIENNIEFGYFFNGRAKSVAEVDKEMYELSFLVRKYPPGMGVWIVMDFLKKVTKPKEEKAKIKFNDTILKEYEKELIRLGLTGKLGIYCKRDALEWFSWEDFQERWWLWLNDPVKDTSELDELLDPKFFDTDNQSGELPAPPNGGFSLSSGGYEEDIVGTGEVAEKACQWAEKIAADNSFAYGKASGSWYHGRDRAHQLGCYFCGTTVHGPKRAKKGSRWEKTYCCNPFICAAYVHGGHIRKKCWKSGMRTESWTKRGFKFIGTNVPRSKLKRGDVILTQSHVKMYIGNGKQVEAAHSGWGSDSIHVCKLKLQVKPYRIVRYKDKKSASSSISSGKKSGAADVVAHAKMRAKTKNKGLRYGNSWGSSSWNGPIMCHGFTRRIFLECGYKEVARRIKAGGFHLHPDSKKNLGVYKTIRATGPRLLESQLEPGDIVCSRFKYNNKKGYAWHSAIYLGDGKVAHSNNGKAYGRTGPKISNFNRTGFNKFLIAFRVIE